MLKKLLIVILSLKTASIFAQYHPFIDENKTWVYNEYLRNAYINDYEKYSFYYFKNDTLIDDVIYTKLYSQQFHFRDVIYNPTFYPRINDTIQKSVLVGLFREDTTKQEVFYKELYWNGQFANEQLWFDFSLNKNDFVINGNLNDDYTKVDSISQVALLNSEIRKCINYSSSKGNKLIEGIGSIHGFLKPHEEYPLGEGSYGGTDLVCYSENNIPLFGTCDQPAYVSTVKPVSFVAKSLGISPNPANNYIQVQIPNDLSSTIAISVFDTNGKLCKKVMTKNAKTTINISDLPAGIYFIKLSDFYKIVEIQKFIKTN